MREIGDTKYYTEDEFDQFDWSILEQGEYATNGTNYSFGKGGLGFPAGEGHIITIFNPDNDGIKLRESVWALPKSLSRYIDWVRKDGAQDKENEIRRVLGL